MDTIMNQENNSSSAPMRTYRIQTQWIMTATVYIAAESLEKAIAQVDDDDGDLPGGAEYLDGSFEVNEELTKELHEQDRLSAEKRQQERELIAAREAKEKEHNAATERWIERNS